METILTKSCAGLLAAGSAKQGGTKTETETETEAEKRAKGNTIHTLS